MHAERDIICGNMKNGREIVSKIIFNNLDINEARDSDAAPHAPALVTVCLTTIGSLKTWSHH